MVQQALGIYVVTAQNTQLDCCIRQHTQFILGTNTEAQICDLEDGVSFSLTSY